MENKKINIAMIGHVDNGKETLAEAIARVLVRCDKQFEKILNPENLYIEAPYQRQPDIMGWRESKGRRRGQRRSRQGF